MLDDSKAIVTLAPPTHQPLLQHKKTNTNPISFLADLSRNKLVEVPGECTNYYSLERLLLYHNIIKSIPDTIAGLQSLVYLDLR